MTFQPTVSAPSDDDSVINGNQMIQQPSTVAEYVIEFLFYPHSSHTNTSVAKTHFAIVQEIHPSLSRHSNLQQLWKYR